MDTTPSEKVKAILTQIDPSRIKDTVTKLVSFETRQTFSQTDSDQRGTGAARKWIQSQLAAAGKDHQDRITVDTHTFTAQNRFTKKTTDGKNIYLKIQGSKHPKQVIVIGAHYDSLNAKDKRDQAIAPGAVDNASGSSLVVELARIFSQHPFDRTVMFVLFDAEEHGLQGSKALAMHLKESDVTVVAMLNNDVVGGDASAKEKNDKDCRLYSAGETHPGTRRLALLAKAAAQQSVPDFKILLQERLDRPGRGGDHMSFHEAGFASIRFIETYETPNHHTPEDILSHVQPEYTARIARLNAALLVSLADGLPAPAEVKAEGNSLSWKAVDGAKGYWVVGYSGKWTGPDPLWMKYTDKSELGSLPQDHRFAVASVREDGTLGPLSDEVNSR